MTQQKPDVTQLRQKRLCDINRFSQLNTLVVGCGAIGRQTARQLGMLHVGNITLVDHDKIEEHNCRPQMFPDSAIGQTKVSFTAKEIVDMGVASNVHYIEDRWRPDPDEDNKYDVVFLCVDSIDVRKIIYTYFKDTVQAIFDVRVKGLDYRVLSVMDDDKEWYGNTLFDGSEADRGGCATDMTCFIANMASGTSIAHFSAWAKHGKEGVVIKNFMYNPEGCAVDDLGEGLGLEE